MSNAEYKFYYFDIRGLGEPIRMLFNIAGQPFEDIRISGENWAAAKQKLPFEKVPMLELKDGRKLAESNAIARYLANKFGLNGKDDWERAKIDEVLDMQKDFYAEIAPFYMLKLGLKPGNADECKTTILEPAIKKYLPFYSQILASSKSGYIAPSGLTFGDFIVANFLTTLKRLAGVELMEKLCPGELNLYIERVFGKVATKLDSPEQEFAKMFELVKYVIAARK